MRVKLYLDDESDPVLSVKEPKEMRHVRRSLFGENLSDNIPARMKPPNRDNLKLRRCG